DRCPPGSAWRRIRSTRTSPERGSLSSSSGLLGNGDGDRARLDLDLELLRRLSVATVELVRQALLQADLERSPGRRLDNGPRGAAAEDGAADLLCPSPPAARRHDPDVEPAVVGLRLREHGEAPED